MTHASPRQRRLAMSVALAIAAAPLATAISHGAAPSRPKPGESAPAPRAAETTAKDGAKPLSWAAVMTFNFAYVKVDDAFKARLAATPANRLKMLRKFAAFEAKHNLREQYRQNAQAVVEAIDAAGPGQPPSDPPPQDPPPQDPPPQDPPPSDPPPSDPPPSDPPPSDPPPSDPPPSDPPPSDPPPSDPPPSDPPPSDPPPSDPPPAPPDTPPPSAAP